MNYPVKQALLFIVLLFSFQLSVADTVRIPVGQQAPELRGLQVPQRGARKEEVESQFGAPQSRSQPVGNPPISYWDYPQFRVYFENDMVLDTVLIDPSLK